MKKLFRRTGRTGEARRGDSFLERDTYWDEEDEETYDWDSAEAIEEHSEEEEAEETSSEEAWVGYEPVEADGSDGQETDAAEEMEIFAALDTEDSLKGRKTGYGRADSREDGDFQEREEEEVFHRIEEESGFQEPEEEAFPQEDTDFQERGEEAVFREIEEESGFQEPEEEAFPQGEDTDFQERGEEEIFHRIEEESGFQEPEEEAFYEAGVEYEPYEPEEDVKVVRRTGKREEHRQGNSDYEDASYEADEEEWFHGHRHSGDREAVWPDQMAGRKQGSSGRASSRTRKQGAGKGRGTRRRRKESPLERLTWAIRNMETMDKVMVITGVAVVVLAIVTGGVFIRINTANRQISDFSSVGRQLEGIDMIGERGLTAVANVRAGLMPSDTASPEDIGDASVEPNFTSVKRDLKIKFVNRDTDKLVAGVPFSVAVTDPEGKEQIWSDDDMDGIIHKKEITPGTYQVAMEPLTDEKYAAVTVFTEQQSVDVKSEITYEKVDVANEVKQESEIDAAKEDTRKNETVVESALEDTLTWVESKIISATYNEVEKSRIPDPVTLAAVQGALYLSAEEAGVMPEAEPEGIVPETPPLTPEPIQDNPPLTPEPGQDNPPLTPEPGQDNPPLTPEPTQDNPPLTPEPIQDNPPLTPEPTQNPTPAEPVHTDAPTPTPSPQVPSVTAAPTARPTRNPGPVMARGSVTVTPTTMSAAVGATVTAKAVTSGFTEGQKLVYTISSSDESVAEATVDAEGNISIHVLKAGTATLTLTANYENGTDQTRASASVAVDIAGSTEFTLDKTELTIYADAAAVVKAQIANGAAAPVLTAVSSDAGIASASVEGTEVTVTGVAEGSADITVTYTGDGRELTAVCKVTVKRHPKDDHDTLLKTVDGEQLYVLEGNDYRDAKRADYYTADHFFVKGNAKYSGWQTVDGKVYYFQADGSHVTGEQVIQGMKYRFAEDGSLVTESKESMGIDISGHNGKVDWNAVKNSGISYVILRCGYRGSAQGSLIEDSAFETNIQGAVAAGLKVGVYFFTQAQDEVEAVEEASMVLEQIKNYQIAYPIFLNVEASGGRGDQIDTAARTGVCRAFCQTIQNGGYTAGIYSNKTWLESKINAGDLSAYKIWLAQYAESPTYQGHYDLWQYRAAGSVSGVSGDVDMNISYLGY